MLAFIIAACGAGSRSRRSTTWLCETPPQPPMTRASSAMPGAPLPPSRQPNVSRTSLRVATRVAVGKSPNSLPHTCSANDKTRSLIMFFRLLLLPRASPELPIGGIIRYWTPVANHDGGLRHDNLDGDIGRRNRRQGFL